MNHKNPVKNLYAFPKDFFVNDDVGLSIFYEDL